MFQAEQDTLVAAMTCQGWENTTDIVGVHIGLTEKGETWQWDNSGKNITSCSERWGRGSPTPQNGEHCAGLWAFSEHGNVLGAHWNDYPCTMKTWIGKPFGVICEIQSICIDTIQKELGTNSNSKLKDEYKISQDKKDT